MTKGVADIFEIAASTAAREADWRFTRPGALVSPRKVGVTEGDSRHACAEASISTFDESQLFNRDCPAVAADQARRGEGGGDHAATFGARRSSRERTDSSFDRDEIVAPLDRDFFQTPSIRSEEHTSELQSLMRISNAVFCI